MLNHGNNVPSSDEIAARIRDRVSALGISPGNLIERSGLSRSTVYRILKEEKAPNLEQLLALLPVLGLTGLDLFPPEGAEGRLLHAVRSSPPKISAVTAALAELGVSLPRENPDNGLDQEGLRRVSDAARGLADSIDQVVKPDRPSSQD